MQEPALNSFLSRNYLHRVPSLTTLCLWLFTHAYTALSSSSGDEDVRLLYKCTCARSESNLGDLRLRINSSWLVSSSYIVHGYRVYPDSHRIKSRSHPICTNTVAFIIPWRCRHVHVEHIWISSVYFTHNKY